MGRERERLLATAQALAHVGCWELDLRTGRALWSDELFRILGRDPEPGVRGQDEIVRHIHPEDRDRITAVLGSVAERPEEYAEAPLTAQFRIVRGDGAVRELRARGQVLRDADGTPARLVATVEDVTGQRIGEREMQAQYAVTQALREWQSFEPGVMELLERFATALRYTMASMWLWDDESGALACRAFWSSPDVDPGYFELAKRNLSFRPGQGKPGVAWVTGETVATPDVVTDHGFQPREAAIQAGVRSALAVPAVARDGPVAVVSLYSFEHRIPSRRIVRCLSPVGRELGGFLARRRAEIERRPLSERETEMLRLAAEGNSGTQIAEALFLSPATVNASFENLCEKLGVTDRAAAVGHALHTGLIP
jgi:PAS domain S-box-containing protein